MQSEENYDDGVTEPAESATVFVGDADPEMDIRSEEFDDEKSTDDNEMMVRETESDSDMKDDDSGDDEEPTYPADCYSFIALHGPFDKGGMFWFGFAVWAFQVAFLILFVLRVADPKFSTNEDTDNPEETFLGRFIPSNVNDLSRATQIMALLSYCIFSDESLRDIVTAVETFPVMSKAKPGDKVGCMITSSVMRFSQGSLATIVVLLMVINTQDVIDIILNFTAVNFISAFDDVAFELAQWGKYGPKLEEEANRIEELPAPKCMQLKNKHTRYQRTVGPIAFILIVLITMIAYRQESSSIWNTQTLRVQFKDGGIFEAYSGCYNLNLDKEKSDKRYIYNNYTDLQAQGKFGYCLDQRKWYLFKGNVTSHVCDIDEDQLVAYSDQTFTFDISSSFESTWYSKTGTPLELYFFDTDLLEEDQCGSFLGDGVCDIGFNDADNRFDEGDCCSATCDPLDCGIGALQDAFGTNVSFGDGFPHCEDPDMKPITIQLNDVYLINDNAFGKGTNPIANNDPRDPLMILDCDDKNVLMVSISVDMKLKTQTVEVADGADCQLTITNDTAGAADIHYVNYTIYHGEKESLENDPIVIASGDSSVNSVTSFQRIRDCFFESLNDYIDNTTIYTADGPSNKAIQWLMEGSLENSNCQSATFVERYALAAINFAAPIIGRDGMGSNLTDDTGLWINEDRQCVWPNVACIDGRVRELGLGTESGIQLSGTIATEIGLLEEITRIDMSYNQITGSIPTEIGDWQNLNYLSVEGNNITGTIPTEIGRLSNLDFIIISVNPISGSIPTEVFQLSKLRGFVAMFNALTGKIPNEVGQATSLAYFGTGNNFLTGTIPSSLGKLTDMNWFESENNALTGTIPSELALMTGIVNLQIASNDLTGPIPVELRTMTISDFNFGDNDFSGLDDVDGQIICPAERGETYCDCTTHCSFKPQQCGCEEAQSCCSSFLAQFTECILCPSRELSNPDFYVADFLTSCEGLDFFFRNNLLEYGNEAACNEAKLFFNQVGCVCVGDESKQVPTCPVETPENGSSCLGPLDTTCPYERVYTGCTWDELECGARQSCLCKDGSWACNVLDLKCKEVTPEGFPFEEPCDPSKELPTPPSEGSETADSVNV